TQRLPVQRAGRHPAPALGGNGVDPAVGKTLLERQHHGQHPFRDRDGAPAARAGERLIGEEMKRERVDSGAEGMHPADTAAECTGQVWAAPRQGQEHLAGDVGREVGRRRERQDGDGREGPRRASRQRDRAPEAPVTVPAQRAGSSQSIISSIQRVPLKLASRTVPTPWGAGVAYDTSRTFGNQCFQDAGSTRAMNTTTRAAGTSASATWTTGARSRKPRSSLRISNHMVAPCTARTPYATQYAPGSSRVSCPGNAQRN